MQLVVEPRGTLRCIYGEEIDLHTLGSLTIERGSHVEPDELGWWWADLLPVHGPRLGPFQRRTEALRAESNWLESNWLLSDRNDQMPKMSASLTKAACIAASLSS
jgi:hypothetical protein